MSLRWRRSPQRPIRTMLRGTPISVWPLLMPGRPGPQPTSSQTSGVTNLHAACSLRRPCVGLVGRCSLSPSLTHFLSRLGRLREYLVLLVHVVAPPTFPELTGPVAAGPVSFPVLRAQPSLTRLVSETFFASVSRTFQLTTTTTTACGSGSCQSSSCVLCRCGRSSMERRRNILPQLPFPLPYGP